MYCRWNCSYMHYPFEQRVICTELVGLHAIYLQLHLSGTSIDGKTPSTPNVHLVDSVMLRGNL